MCGMVYTRENFNQLLEEQTVSRSQIDQLKTENRLLQEKIQCLMKRLFGRSSEKLSPDQLELELEELRELQEALELAETKAELAEEEQKESNANTLQKQHNIWEIKGDVGNRKNSLGKKRNSTSE